MVNFKGTNCLSTVFSSVISSLIPIARRYENSSFFSLFHTIEFTYCDGRGTQTPWNTTRFPVSGFLLFPFVFDRDN